MNIDFAVELWKEVRSFIHDNHDKKEAGEAVATVLLEHFDADDIVDAFKFDKNVVNSVAEQTGTEVDDNEMWDDYD